MKATALLSRSSRAIVRRSSLRSSSLPRPATTRAVLFIPYKYSSTTPNRLFTTTSSTRKGLIPGSAEPEAPKTEDHDVEQAEAAHLSDSEYHEISDQYLNTLVLALEEIAEDTSNGVEVEYSAGVLTVNHPRGTYVLNKQPPNKQIWLSSPMSGPKRFDWVLGGDAQHQKAETEMDVGDDGEVGGGKWTYLRDGTTLGEILKKELEVEIAAHGESDATKGREGPGGG